ncbi:MAG: Hsp20/alpha crystallin family protein [Armatimonadota bacterium]|nr:MAG: Hsp20/alpha crystallin family protein [Armatimonadota bacterium]
MSTRHWDIFGQAGPLRLELERFASELLPDRARPDEESPWAPPVDIYERDDSLVLLMDLPGITREDIDLQVDSNTLTVQGERPGEAAAATIRRERRSGRFRRSFRLGLPIDPAKVRASYRAGVLEITLPKAASRGPARVPIDTG